VAVAPKFKGTLDQKIDVKGRVSVPAALRKVAEQCDPDFVPPLDKSNKGTPASILIVFEPGKMNCLECYSVAGMAEIDAMIDSHDIGSPERDALEYRYHANVTLTEIDSDGRIVIPLSHRTKLGLEGDIRFVGLGDRFEIWTLAAFDASRTSPTQELATRYGENLNLRSLLQAKRVE
jgi:MraZ protein